MTSIEFKKINESTAQVDSEDKSVLYDLSDYFSYYSPGYKFSPAFKNHLWDGKIRLFNLRTRALPIGLIDSLREFCTKRHYDLCDSTPLDDRYVPPEPEEVEAFLQGLSLPFEMRGYQKDAVRWSLDNGKGILLSPTGSGKSLIIYALLRYFAQSDLRIVVIVPTTSLVEQMLSDFSIYAKNDPEFIVDERVWGLYSRRKTDPYTAPIVVSTWQSLKNYDKKLFASWDVVICDEVHGAKASVLSKIIGSAVNAVYKIGCTGSLTGEDTHTIQLQALFGRIKQVTTTVALQDEGSLCPMKIYMLQLRYDKRESQEFYKSNPKDWQAEIHYITHHPKRQLFLRNLALRCKGTTVLFFNYKAQGEELYRLISEAADSDHQVFHIDGDVDTADRERIRQSALSNANTILVASVGTSSTGINIPSIENIILYNSKSRVRNLQSIGRGLRLDKQKSGCRIFDIVDDMSYRTHKNYCLRHGIERYKLYQEEGFNVELKLLEF